MMVVVLVVVVVVMMMMMMMMMMTMMMMELVMQSTTWSVTTVLTQYETLPIHCKMVDTRECMWLADSPGDVGGAPDSPDRG